MVDLLITAFILIANIVAILLVYHSFDIRIEKNRKLMYTMIAFGIIYILTLIIYFFSSLGIDNKNISDSSQNMITFTFVPINTIILLPILIKTFNNRKNRKISTSQLNRTAIIILVVAIILVVLEFFCFRNMQKGIIDIFNDLQKNSINQTTNVQEESNSNTTNNANIETNTLSNANIESNTESSGNIENNNINEILSND